MSLTFNQLRTQIISMENHLSNHLSTYSSFTSSPSSSATPEELEAENKIEATLTSIGELIRELNKVVDSQSSENTISTSKLQQLTRHKENLNQSKIDYKRIKSTIQQERSRLNLLFDVRTDIEDHQRRVTDSTSSNVGDEDGYMLNERLRLNQQHNAMDTLISQVYETRDEILRQRNTLSNFSNKIQRSLSTMPGLNVLLKKINTRKKRDSLILAGLISSCIILLWFLS
ncbi:hypothetical protein CANARDRAFT_4955 [[Candida] arabinofermentans NRRL YB-2248]|uniref:Golgi SNAP receptor complex member 1 n=1 Tax=[Candida] arabinofermentans NRRL YB-2248 TaxID=983967 RepID=A0A1E4T793_9ASCO|nr:hypothetical protein CANARDRAFT_4955 [[Candida] arabinofermentans NRRL YB-2248]